MLKTGCTAAYDLFMALPAITDETFEAVARAYTDVGVRVVLAPAVADIVFYQTVPGLLDLLPSDLRRTVEAMQPAPTKGLLDLTDRAIRRWHGAARRAHPGRRRADHSRTRRRTSSSTGARGSRGSTGSGSTRTWPSRRSR